jgi:hypothetical protein
LNNTPESFFNIQNFETCHLKKNATEQNLNEAIHVSILKNPIGTEEK